MTRRKIFQARKFYGEEWAVVDTKRNATLGVAESRRAAQEICEKLNAKLQEKQASMKGGA